jgi:hypothetical protein
MLFRRGLYYKAFAEIQLACSGCQEFMNWGDHDMTHDAGYTALVGIDWADTKGEQLLREGHAHGPQPKHVAWQGGDPPFAPG